LVLGSWSVVLGLRENPQGLSDENVASSLSTIPFHHEPQIKNPILSCLLLIVTIRQTLPHSFKVYWLAGR
jgi:hypothetical protein